MDHSQRGEEALFIRMKNSRWILLVFSILLAGCGLAPGYEEMSVTVDAYQEPAQRLVSGEPILLESLFGSCELHPKAEILMQGRVLNTRQYDLDWRAVCSPLDIALGWGPMADREVDQWVQWRQSRRWYFSRISPGAPVPYEDVALHSSNVHIVPANNNLSRALLSLDDDDIVLLEGSLVDVGVDVLGVHFETTTSLSRSDRGAGACEILYVRRLVVDGKEYR